MSPQPRLYSKLLNRSSFFYHSLRSSIRCILFNKRQNGSWACPRRVHFPGVRPDIELQLFWLAKHGGKLPFFRAKTGPELGVQLTQPGPSIPTDDF